LTFIESLFDLSGKVILVTGSCGQLGREVCHSLSQANAQVIGLDIDTSINRIDGVQYLDLDTTDIDKKRNIFSEVFREHNQVDVLINNAGVSTFENFEDRTEEKFDWVTDINLKGVFFDIQIYVNLFDKYNLKSGSIINIASTYGLVSPDPRIYIDLPRKNSEIYGATKAGVIQMSKYFSVHLAERNIRVNCISPGGIFNPENPQGEEFQREYAYRTPLKRMARADEISGAVIYLASDSSSYTTGQNITIDGGFTAW